METLHIVEIRYCSRCKWLLRASWYAQEVLSTFQDELGGVNLRSAAVPGEFSIHLGEVCLFDRKTHGGFIEAKELKRRIRDQITPERDLGHIDQ